LSFFDFAGIWTVRGIFLGMLFLLIKTLSSWLVRKYNNGDIYNQL
jgi:hypothetical protein